MNKVFDFNKSKYRDMTINEIRRANGFEPLNEIPFSINEPYTTKKSNSYTEVVVTIAWIGIILTLVVLAIIAH